jgi:hypothetical protein
MIVRYTIFLLIELLAAMADSLTPVTDGALDDMDSFQSEAHGQHK